MLKKVRQAERDFNRRQSSEFARTHAGDGSFTYNGYEGSFWVKRVGDGMADLDVYYPLGNFSWSDRSDVERQVQNFLRKELRGNFNIRYIYVHNNA